MTFKEKLKAKIQLDRLVQNIGATMRETPGQRRLNKEAVRNLLGMTDFEHRKVRDLEVYVRSIKGEQMQVLVLDNELPFYRTTVADVAMRKTPYWKEMLSPRNVIKILNDQDVIISKGKATLKYIHENALSHMDLSYSAEDLTSLVGDADRALRNKSPEEIEEVLDLFFELVGFEPVSLGMIETSVEVFGRPKTNGEPAQLYEDLLIFDEQNARVMLMKGEFSPRNDLHIARFLQITRGERPPDVEGREVFELLAGFALGNKEKRQADRQALGSGLIQ